MVHKILDSNFKQVNYRGLDYYPIYISRSGLGCDVANYRVDDGEEQEVYCTNSKGEDMSRTNDATGGLQITYNFR